MSRLREARGTEKFEEVVTLRGRGTGRTARGRRAYLALLLGLAQPWLLGRRQAALVAAPGDNPCYLDAELGCLDAAKQCGPISDLCGGTIDCGACASACTAENPRGGCFACPGLTVPAIPSNILCQCVPSTWEDEGAMCGLLADNCDGTIDCGRCSENSRCAGVISRHPQMRRARSSRGRRTASSAPMGISQQQLRTTAQSARPVRPDTAVHAAVAQPRAGGRRPMWPTRTARSACASRMKTVPRRTAG